MTIKTKNTEALNTFVALAAQIKSQLDRLQGAADDHFDVDADEVGWPHGGDLTDYTKVLKNLTDWIFNEGEYATENK